MIDNYLVQTCYLVGTTINSYGDREYSSLTTLKCRFREISTTRDEPHSEIRDADAMLWLQGGVSVNRGSIISYDGVYYKVERTTFARRLGETNVLFLKCDLKVFDIS